MHKKKAKKPKYGLQAPKELLVFVLLTIVFLIAFIFISTLWKYFFLAGFIYFLYTTIRILVGSTNWARERLNKFIVTECKAKKGMKILDVGCGGGSLSIAFAKQIKEGEVWGIDIWKKGDLLGNAPERTLENIKIEGVENIVKIKSADARNIPFPDNYFDIVSSVFTLHNIHPDREKAIFEMIRVLKPGGILAIVDPMIWWLKYDIIPKLPKGKRLINLRSKRYFLIKLFLAEKERNF